MQAAQQVAGIPYAKLSERLQQYVAVSHSDTSRTRAEWSVPFNDVNPLQQLQADEAEEAAAEQLDPSYLSGISCNVSELCLHSLPEVSKVTSPCHVTSCPAHLRHLRSQLNHLSTSVASC